MLLTRMPSAILPPRAVMLTQEIALVAFQADDDAIAASLFGAEPPYGTVDVLSAFGPSKIVATRLSAHDTGSDQPDANDDFAPIILGSDVAELADELDMPSRRRLLGFMLGFCRKAFDIGRNAAFAAACLRLARLCDARTTPVDPVASVTPAWVLFAGLEIPTDASIFQFSGEQVRRTSAHALGSAGNLRAVERCATGDILLALSDEPVMWTVAPARGELRDLINAPVDDELRTACLRILAPVCPIVRARAREIGLLAPASAIKHDDPRQPIGAALEAALPSGEGRIFLRGWLRDPMHLVQSAELRGPTGSTPIALEELHRFRRADVAKRFASAAFSDPAPRLGFAAYVADPTGGLSLQPSLVFHLRGGHRIGVRPPMQAVEPPAARNGVLTSMPPDEVTDAVLETCLGPAAAAFHRDSLADRGTPDLIEIGTPPPRPHISIIIPLYRTLSFLRFQVAAFASDPGLRGAELIFVLDSPEQRSEVEHLLRGLYVVHRMPMALVVLTRNLGYAAANNAAAAFAHASVLLLLNSDVVPAGPGWLAPLTEALEQPGVAAVGPKLLFDDESLQHAGLFFRRDNDGIWLNAHYHKGMPRRWPGAEVARTVPGLTGAALMVRRDAFERVGGICEDYIIGDYEDSDFCLRLRESGKELAYVPKSELFHFERRSISLHKGYAGTLACRYNRWLHHQRWDASIADLMDRPNFRLLPQSIAA